MSCILEPVRRQHQQTRSNENYVQEQKKQPPIPVPEPIPEPVPDELNDEDHHYFLYQPVEIKEEGGQGQSSTSAKKDNLALPVNDPTNFANSRLMTPIAEEESQLSSDEDSELDNQDVVTTPVQDHIYCSISDDDLPSKVFEDSLAESSFPDIVRPSIDIAPRLPPRKPEFNTITTLPSTATHSSNGSAKLTFDKPGQSQGSSESLKSLSTESSSHTVRNCGTVTGSTLSSNIGGFDRHGSRKSSYKESGAKERSVNHAVQHSLASQPVSIQSGSKINKSTSLSSVCCADANSRSHLQQSSQNQRKRLKQRLCL